MFPREKLKKGRLPWGKKEISFSSHRCPLQIGVNSMQGLSSGLGCCVSALIRSIFGAAYEKLIVCNGNFFAVVF